jgi:hypothetical protein
MRTSFYVDAFNLYYGCLKGTPHKWLDLRKLFTLAFPANQINHIHYFTAKVTARPSDPQQPIRQETYLRALLTLPNLTIHYGQYLASQPWMMLVNPPPGGPDRVRVHKSEEKGSDVNMACQLLVDAFDSAFDVAVVVSNDSDLATPIRIVRKKFNRPVLALLPCTKGRPSSVELRKVASKGVMVDAAHLPLAQSPPNLTDAKGTFHKPASW